MAIVERIPAPKGQVDAPLSGPDLDSMFNSFRGVILFQNTQWQPEKRRQSKVCQFGKE